MTFDKFITLYENLDWNFTEVFSYGPIYDMQAFVQMMACRLLGDKPSIWTSDGLVYCIRIYALLGLNELIL